jgi:hypothetical protein
MMSIYIPPAFKKSKSAGESEEKQPSLTIKFPAILRRQYYGARKYYQTQVEEEEKIMRRIGKDKNIALGEVQRLQAILAAEGEITVRALRNLANENYSKNSTAAIFDLTRGTGALIENKSTVEILLEAAQLKFDKLSVEYASHLAERNAHREQIKFHEKAIIDINKAILFPHMGETEDSLGYSPPSI